MQLPHAARRCPARVRTGRAGGRRGPGDHDRRARGSAAAWRRTHSFRAERDRLSSRVKRLRRVQSRLLGSADTSQHHRGHGVHANVLAARQHAVVILVRDAAGPDLRAGLPVPEPYSVRSQHRGPGRAGTPSRGCAADMAGIGRRDATPNRGRRRDSGGGVRLGSSRPRSVTPPCAPHSSWEPCGARGTSSTSAMGCCSSACS